MAVVKTDISNLIKGGIMPYTVSSPPKRIKGLPKHAQEIWIKAFNSALKQYGDEIKANKVAWAAVKKAGYVKRGEKWVKAEDQPIFVFTLHEPQITELSDNLFKKQVLRLGKWIYQGRPFVVTKEYLKKIYENFKKKILENVFVPFTHSDDPRNNAGFVKDLELKEDGLYAVLEVDDDASKLIKEGKVKGVSASIEEGYVDKEKGVEVGPVLRHVALVMEPYIKGLKPFIQLSEPEREVIEMEEINLSKWTRKYINDLPDSAFLYIEPGGEKDEEGKTKPRSLRHFPYKNAEGKVDLPHLRNALARIPQSKLSEEVKERVIAKARRIAKKYGIGVKEKKGGEKKMAEEKKTIKKTQKTVEEKTAKTKILEDVVKEKKELEDKVKKLEDKVRELKTKRRLEKAKATAEKWLSDGKIVPAQKDAAIKILTEGGEKTVELSDKEKTSLSDLFKQFVKNAPKIELEDEKGATTGGEKEPGADLDEKIKTQLEKMGISLEDYEKYGKEMSPEELAKKLAG